MDRHERVTAKNRKRQRIKFAYFFILVIIALIGGGTFYYFSRPNAVDKDSRTETINLSGNKIFITSSIPNVHIWVNNKPTGFTATYNTAKTKFGPYANKTKIYGVVTFPWGEAKSEVKKVTDETREIDITPNMLNEPLKGSLKDSINEFAQQKINALKKQDISVLKNADGPAKKEVEDIIEDDKFTKSIWRGYAVSTRINFSPGKVKFTQNKGIYQIKLPVEFRYKQNEYSPVDLEADPAAPLNDETNIETVTLIYNKDKWLVTDEDDTDQAFEGEDIVISRFK